MKLFGSPKDKITKNKNDENLSHLESTEVALVHCNITNNDYQQKCVAQLSLSKKYM